MKSPDDFVDNFADNAVQCCLSVARTIKGQMDLMRDVAALAQERRQVLGADDEGFCAWRGSSLEVTTALREFLEMLAAAQNPKINPKAH